MGKPVHRVVLWLDDEWYAVLKNVILDQVEGDETATEIEHTIESV